MTETSRTLAEIAATVRLALRGSGCAWDMADEAGEAARCLAARGLPVVEALASLIKTDRSCSCSGGATGPRCCVGEMAALSDDLPEDVIKTGSVVGPLVLAAAWVRHGRTCRIDWTDGWVICGPDGSAAGGTPCPNLAESVTIRSTDLPTNNLPTGWQSRAVDAAAWQVLTTAAARTTVPETAHSRASGAGPDAGNSD